MFPPITLCFATNCQFSVVQRKLCDENQCRLAEFEFSYLTTLYSATGFRWTNLTEENCQHDEISADSTVGLLYSMYLADEY